MIDKNMMLVSVKGLCAAFTLNRTEQQIKDYCSITYKVLESEGVTDKEFADAMMHFMKTTEATAFKSLPSPADFLKLMNKAPKSIEQIAEEQYIQVVSTLDSARLRRWVMYDHPVTNKTVQSLYGSPRKIYWKYFDTTNPYNERPTFLKKNFIENWICNYAANSVQHMPVQELSNDFEKGEELLMIGDRAKCEENELIGREEYNQQEMLRGRAAPFKVEYKKDKQAYKEIELLKENK